MAERMRITGKNDGTNDNEAHDAQVAKGIDALHVKSHVYGYDGIGFTDPIYSNNGAIYVADYALEVAKGNVANHSYIHKFGEAPDFDTGDGFVTVWDGADDANTNAMQYTYSSTADIGLLSSSNAGDNQTVEIQGLASDGTQLTQTFTLNGTTDVDLSATGSNYLRVFRIKNTGTTNFAGDIYVRTDGSTATGGVPDTANTVRAKVQSSNNQTLMAIYTIPTGCTGYLDSFYASLRGTLQTLSVDIHLLARPSGGVFQLKNSQEVSSDGPRFQHIFKIPEKFDAGTDIEIRAGLDTAAKTAVNIAAGFDMTLVAD